ncbi:MAG TPA: hypothetical protein VED01_05295 [Burkholderiales bacterium]|nr:hypothetical protein [Burkholderiales bacterium]
MKRDQKSAQELQELIQRRINELDGVYRGIVRVTAPRVQPCSPAHDGCNWSTEPYTGPPAYASVVDIIVQTLRKRFDLADRASEDTPQS